MLFNRKNMCIQIYQCTYTIKSFIWIAIYNHYYNAFQTVSQLYLSRSI